MKASNLIQDNKDQILNRWLTRVKQEIPESDAHQKYSVKNNIPVLIEDLCELLDNGEYRSRIHSSKDHGEKRSDFENYSLMHVIREYRILKQVIFDLLDEKNNLKSEERNAIMYVIDQAIEQAGEAFFNMRQDEKEEARQKAEGIAENIREEVVLRDNFFSGVTHDLKNPISNIMMAVDCLENYDVDQKARSRLLKGIKMSAERAEALIRDLLDINLIKSGNQLPVNPEKSDMLELIRESVQSFKTQGQQPIHTEFCCESLWGLWDSSLVNRAIDNLLQNAIKYGEVAAPISIIVTRDEQYALLSVHNEGMPIPEEKRESLFNRFYRADEAQASGWGLGLALVQGIAQAHGGEVELESEKDKGTTFTLKIPHKSVSSNGQKQELHGNQV